MLLVGGAKQLNSALEFPATVKVISLLSSCGDSNCFLFVLSIKICTSEETNFQMRLVREHFSKGGGGGGSEEADRTGTSLMDFVAATAAN